MFKYAFYICSAIVVSSCNIEIKELPPISDASPEIPGISISAKVIDDKCPEDMVFVSGNYCINPKEECIEWLDPEKSIVRRCKKYKESLCDKTKQLSFCIDKEEYSEPSNNSLPISNVSWTEAKKICAMDGKRLCAEEEWTFACEGEKSLPYPYGYERNDYCNIDNTDLVDNKGEMRDLRRNKMENQKCLSPFDIHNMTGNEDEWIICNSGSYPFRSCLKGGWWGPLRNRCRATTAGHDEYFKEIQTGFRCCSEPRAKNK